MPTIKNTKFYIALFLFLGVFIAINFLYFLLNKAPQAWDSSAHINLSMLYAIKVLEGDFGKLLTLSGYYPPFIHYIGAIVYLVTKSSTLILLLSFVFYLVGVFYLIKLCTTFTKNWVSILLVVVFWSLLPQVGGEIRLFQLDLPLTVLITASLYHLRISNKLTLKKHIYLFFVFFALAMLTKWYAFVFLIAPVLFSINYKKVLKLNYLKQLIMGAIIFLAITLPWYLLNFNSILSFFGSVSSLGELNDPQGFYTKENFTEYLNLMFAYQTTFVVGVTLLVSLVIWFIKNPKLGLYFASYILVPLFIFTVLSNKDVRYIMPLTPIFAIMLVTSFENLTKWLKYSIYAVLLLYLSLVFYVFGFYQQKTINIAFANSVTGSFNKYKWVQINPSEQAYKNQNWQLDKMYNQMVNDLDKYSDKNTKVLFGVDYKYFNSVAFNRLQIENSTYYQVTSGFGVLELGLTENNIDSILSNYKYIVTAYNPGETNLRFYNDLVVINRYLQGEGAQSFDSKAKYTLPNGEDVYLFRNIKYREPYETQTKQDIEILFIQTLPISIR